METEKSAKERVKDKLSNALKQDIKESKIETSIESIKKIDGRLKARFSIRGLPRKEKDSYESSYRDIDKIFDSWAELSKYAETFFSATDEELKKIAKSQS